MQAAELGGGVGDPLVVGHGVWAEGFDRAELLIVKERAMEAERAGLRGIDEARGIVGAHLEDDAHFEFSERLAIHPAAYVVIAVDRHQQMDPVAAPFGDYIIELQCRVRRAPGIAA